MQHAQGPFQFSRLLHFKQRDIYCKHCLRATSAASPLPAPSGDTASPQDFNTWLPRHPPCRLLIYARLCTLDQRRSAAAAPPHARKACTSKHSVATHRTPRRHAARMPHPAKRSGHTSSPPREHCHEPAEPIRPFHLKPPTVLHGRVHAASEPSGFTVPRRQTRQGCRWFGQVHHHRSARGACQGQPQPPLGNAARRPHHAEAGPGQSAQRH